jgi:hypothetical protein
LFKSFVVQAKCLTLSKNFFKPAFMNHNVKYSSIISAILALAAPVFIFSCKKSGSTRPPAPTTIAYKGTSSPGDVYTWTLDTGAHTFSAIWDHGTTDPSDDITFSGPYITLPSGFLKMTIASVSPASSLFPTDGSAYYYALEVPGVVLFADPEGSIVSRHTITSVHSGESTGFAGSYNYAATSMPSGINPETNEAFGNISFTAAGTDAYTVGGHKYSFDYFPSGVSTVNSPITIGTATVDPTTGTMHDPTGTVTLQATAAGALIVDGGAGSGGAFAGRQDSVAFADLASLSFSCIGYNNMGNEAARYKFTFGASGNSANLWQIEDVSSGTVSPAIALSLTFNSINQAAFWGSMVSEGVTQYVYGFVIKYNGKYIITLESVFPASTPLPTVSFLLGTQN